jgi:hypothetical protein
MPFMNLRMLRGTIYIRQIWMLVKIKPRGGGTKGKKKDWVPGEGGETGTQREINGVSGYRIRFI